MEGTVTGNDMHFDNINRTGSMVRDKFSGGVLPLLLWGISAIVLVVWFILGNTASFGNLPGDVSIAAGDVRIYLPFTTTILVSVVITGFFYALGNFFSRQ
jgi:hypothetical protein